MMPLIGCRLSRLCAAAALILTIAAVAPAIAESAPAVLTVDDAVKAGPGSIVLYGTLAADDAQAYGG